MRAAMRVTRAAWLVASRRYRPCVGSCLVLAPHPDDETLGCGGTIASLTRRGVRVVLVVATNGALSDRAGRPEEEVIEVRRQEALEAAKRLGVDAHDVHFLELPDGELAEHVAVARDRIQDVVVSCRPEHVLVCSAMDPHQDHVALNSICAALSLGEAALFEYLVWAWPSWPRAALRVARGRPGGLRGGVALIARELRRSRRVGIGSVRALKRAAFDEYVSQHGDGRPGRGVPPGLAADYFGRVELLMLVHGEQEVLR